MPATRETSAASAAGWPAATSASTSGWPATPSAPTGGPAEAPGGSCRCTSRRAPGSFKILCPGLSAITHDLLPVQILYGLVIILYGSPGVGLPLLPLIVCLVALEDISIPVGEYIVPPTCPRIAGIPLRAGPATVVESIVEGRPTSVGDAIAPSLYRPSRTIVEATSSAEWSPVAMCQYA